MGDRGRVAAHQHLMACGAAVLAAGGYLRLACWSGWLGRLVWWGLSGAIGEPGAAG